MSTIRPNQLADEILKELTIYTKEVAAETKKACKRIAQQATKELKQTSPKNTGKYAQGWTSKTMYDDPSDTRILVHNAKSYRLTHILEDGHDYVGRNGKRVANAVKAQPHIASVEQKAVQELSSAIERIVQQ